MPFRVSSGPAVGRTIVIAHSAIKALRIYRMLKEQSAKNLEISHLELGELSLHEIEAMAKADRRPQLEVGPG